jgi:hypothetical protein
MSHQKNLAQLIKKSRSSREFLLSLPVSVQLQLHEQSDNIRSAEDLHTKADLLLNHQLFLQKMDL